MPASLPYLTSPGTVDTAFRRMKEAATPVRFTNDFVNNTLRIKGGSGRIIPPLLKKLGFLNTDGTPTALYAQFRNEGTSSAAVAEAIRIGYRPLFRANENVHELGGADLKGLIVQVSGLDRGSSVVAKMVATFQKLGRHAVFDEESEERGETAARELIPQTGVSSQRALSLSHTINLNLPATTNIEVFNAIFKSLREYLLDD